MNYNINQIKILNIYGSEIDSQFVEFRDLSDNKVKILKLENFNRRYGVKDDQ